MAGVIAEPHYTRFWAALRQCETAGPGQIKTAITGLTVMAVREPAIAWLKRPNYAINANCICCSRRGARRFFGAVTEGSSQRRRASSTKPSTAWV